MKPVDWQLKTPIDAILFDCDGTLSRLEGIDVLAEKNGVLAEVGALTAEAMGTSGLNPELYQKRLNLVAPKKSQVDMLGHLYFMHQSPHAFEVIQLLNRLQKNIYVVSAGLFPAIKIFADYLKIPQKNIFAVDIHFDAAGNFSHYDHTSVLVHNTGKRDIVKQLQLHHQHILHIGDGLNDYVTHDLVTRFVGYGGVFYREKIASVAPYYIKNPSLSALLPYALTQAEQEMLTTEEQKLFQQGLEVLVTK